MDESAKGLVNDPFLACNRTCTPFPVQAFRTIEGTGGPAPYRRGRAFVDAPHVGPRKVSRIHEEAPVRPLAVEVDISS